MMFSTRQPLCVKSFRQSAAELFRRLWLCLLLAWPGLACAYINIDNAAVTQSLTWSGGDLVVTQKYCIISENGNANSPPTSPVAQPYSVTVTSTSAALNLTGPGTALPVTATWTDLTTNATQALAYGVTSAQTNTGVIDTVCPALNNNATNNGQATLTLLASDLVNRPPGTYTNTFTFQVRNSATGKKNDKSTITLNVTIPTVLQMSGLSTIALGTWSGVGAMTGSDTLCVYINSGALYSVAVTGSGTGGAYSVANGASSIPFTATWNDGTGAAALTTGVKLTGRANANTTNNTCNAGAANNATLAVSVAAANLQAATLTGNYTGTLTVTVSTP